MQPQTQQPTVFDEALRALVELNASINRLNVSCEGLKRKADARRDSIAALNVTFVDVARTFAELLHAGGAPTWEADRIATDLHRFSRYRDALWRDPVIWGESRDEEGLDDLADLPPLNRRAR